MDEIELIRCLLSEIESEKKYAEEKELAEKNAKKDAEAHGHARNQFWLYMPEEYIRTPSQAKIKRCAMLIRETCLKLYK